MSWITEAKERWEKANRYDNEGLTYRCVTEDLPKALDLLERAKKLLNPCVDLLLGPAEDWRPTIHDAQYIKEVNEWLKDLES
jgi:hypothetical protein